MTPRSLFGYCRPLLPPRLHQRHRRAMSRRQVRRRRQPHVCILRVGHRGSTCRRHQRHRVCTTLPVRTGLGVCRGVFVAHRHAVPTRQVQRDQQRDDVHGLPAGYFGNVSGLTGPGCSGACDPGWISAAGAAVCVPCPVGTASPAAASTACSACSSGSYCPGGAPSQLCPAGQYSVDTGGTSLASCSLCDEGYYGATAGQKTSTCSGQCIHVPINVGKGCLPGSTSVYVDSRRRGTRPGVSESESAIVSSPAPSPLSLHSTVPFRRWRVAVSHSYSESLRLGVFESACEDRCYVDSPAECESGSVRSVHWAQTRQTATAFQSRLGGSITPHQVLPTCATHCQGATAQAARRCLTAHFVQSDPTKTAPFPPPLTRLRQAAPRVQQGCTALRARRRRQQLAPASPHPAPCAPRRRRPLPAHPALMALTPRQVPPRARAAPVAPTASPVSSWRRAALVSSLRAARVAAGNVSPIEPRSSS